jgi:hypothetical protein
MILTRAANYTLDASDRTACLEGQDRVVGILLGPRKSNWQWIAI